MLQYACENCGQLLEAEEHQIGHQAKCPACGHVGVVPGRSLGQAVQVERRSAAWGVDREKHRDDGPSRYRDLRDDMANEPPRQSSSALPIVFLVIGILAFVFLAVVSLGAVLLAPAVAKVREAAARLQTQNNLKQVGLAMHNFHDVNGAFPMPTGFRTKEGKPGLSWRVALLPYLEEEMLFREFKLDEPWDSPHNQALLSRMPKVYSMPGADPANSQGLTYFQVIKGKDFLFDDNYLSKQKPRGPELLGRPINQVTDGLSNTLLAVVAREPVPWTKPEDIDGDDGRPIEGKLDDRFGKMYSLLLADGATRLQRPGKTQAEWKALLTANGGEIVPFD